SPKAESALRLELDNGSRVISLPASEATIRGYSAVDLLLIDEAARVADDLYSTVRPMLATSNGRLIALSTPFGRRGWWSDAWHGSHDWKRVQITAEQCPRIPPAFLAEEREQIGAWWFQQEYECMFLDAESQAFSTAESRLRLELENGSRVISLPASEATIRGFAGVSLLIVDEAARVEDGLYFSIRPMLATSNGRLIALSTPYGKRGWWSDAWHGSHDWKRVQITAEQCPRISAAFLAEEREQIGAWWFDQEYGCQFLDAESQAFSTADIERAQVGEGVELWTL
ncbi:MAG: hypothetical protein M3451_08730, partial [Chloroflexota bacterium]|nr:hypothetical protein [Chloroflexota bacterium]